MIQQKRQLLFRWQLEDSVSAERLRHAAHWASWADMLSSRVPLVATNFITALEAGESTPIQSVLSCVDNLAGAGFVVFAWAILAQACPFLSNTHCFRVC